MLLTLIERELRAILGSPKFWATFAACSLLLVLSTVIGLREHDDALARHEAFEQLTDQQMREATGWLAMRTAVHRPPAPLQVLVAGTDYDVGRRSGVSIMEPVKLNGSVYSDDPLFAVFRFLDFAFIVQVVLSLFALLFTHDAVSGEREAGTLRLVFSHPVPRSTFLAAKLVGTWLALVIPLSIPVLVSLLLVVMHGVPLDGDDWSALVALGAASLLYFTFFLVFGLLASVVSRRSSVSFLLCLVTWVTLVLVVPRAAVMVAGQAVAVPSAAEVDGQLEAFSKQRWATHLTDMQDLMRERARATEGMAPEERQAYEDDHMWDWMEEGDKKRKAAQDDIDAHSRALQEDLRNREAAQERLALELARVSPAGAFQLAALRLAGTDQGLKQRWLDALDAYRQVFKAHVQKKQEESEGGARVGAISFSWNSDSGVKITTGRGAGQLDLSGLPRFQPPGRELAAALAASAVDLGLLATASLVAFLLAFVAFLRADVR